MIEVKYFLFGYHGVRVERIMSAFSVACASGHYKREGMTVCKACETGTEPNPAKTACGKRVLRGKIKSVKFLMKLLKINDEVISCAIATGNVVRGL